MTDFHFLPCVRSQPAGWKCTRFLHLDGPCALVRAGQRGWLIDRLRDLADWIEYGKVRR